MKKELFCIFIIFLLVAGCTHRQMKTKALPLPHLKEEATLRYPVAAQQQGLEGTVKLKLLVNEQGAVTNVTILQSSGVAMLDDAAVEYAGGLKFYPPIANGKPAPAAVSWNVRFELSKVNRFAAAYVNRIEDLIKKAAQADSQEKNKLLGEMLAAHVEYANGMSDNIHYNDYIEKIIRAETLAQWRDIWHDCPLRFVVFDDFLGRYPDYTKKSSALALLRKMMREDIEYVKQLYRSGAIKKNKTDYILNKIENFANEKYP